MTGITRNLLGVALATSLIAAAGCNFLRGSDRADVQAFDTPAQVLATEAETLYLDGDYEKAAETFQQIKDRFPYSRYALLADLRVGDAYLKSKRYEEALLAYDDFIRLHPKNEAVPYAIYQMGMVYHAQILTPDLDPTNSRKATENFERLFKEYPQSEWAIKAKPRYEEAMAGQATHDLFVGKYYYRTKRYQAAVGRFKRVLTNYPDVGLYGEAIRYIELVQQKLAAEPGHGESGERRDLVSPPADFNRPDIFTDIPGRDSTVNEDIWGRKR